MSESELIFYIIRSICYRGKGGSIMILNMLCWDTAKKSLTTTDINPSRKGSRNFSRSKYSLVTYVEENKNDKDALQPYLSEIYYF